MAKRFALLFACLLALCEPAHAAMVLSIPITTAITTSISGNFQLRSPRGLPVNVGVQCNFVYGSGGTTVSAWVQTSFDGGTTWTDVAQCGFTTVSARQIYNLSSLTPQTTAVVPTDGTLAANTAKDGLVGSVWRVKYSSTGTYAGTTLRIDLITTGLTSP